MVTSSAWSVRDPGAFQGNRNGRKKAVPVHRLPGITSSHSRVTSQPQLFPSLEGKKGFQGKARECKSVESLCIWGEPGVGGCSSVLSAQLQGVELLQLCPGQMHDSASAACSAWKAHTCCRGLEEGGGQSRRGTFCWQVSNL